MSFNLLESLLVVLWIHLSLIRCIAHRRVHINSGSKRPLREPFALSGRNRVDARKRVDAFRK